MKHSHRIGIIHGLLSGLFWAAYTVTLYSWLSPYNGDTGTLDSAQGVMFIILAAVGIAWIDSLLTSFFDICYCIRQKKFAEFKRCLLSKTFFRIMPAAFFAAPLGIVPYSIASRYSVPVATSVSSFYPALASIVSVWWFKEKMSPTKFVGILIAIMGVVVASGFSGLQVAGILFSIMAAVGYALELVFGYRLMSEEVDSDVTVALRQVAGLSLHTVILLVLWMVPGNFEFSVNLIKAIDFSVAYEFTKGMLGSTPMIIFVFCLASFFGATAFIFYYSGMKYAGVGTASTLNMTYAVWTIIILALPPFLDSPSLVNVISALLTFTGSAIVIFETNRLEKAG